VSIVVALVAQMLDRTVSPTVRLLSLASPSLSMPLLVDTL